MITDVEFVDRQERERWRQTREAMASVAQGKVVAGEAVHSWLQSWGGTDELPPPKGTIGFLV